MTYYEYLTGIALAKCALVAGRAVGIGIHAY